MIWKNEYDLLAQYNAEVARGLVHTTEWVEKMKELQKDYDKACATRAGWNLNK